MQDISISKETVKSFGVLEYFGLILLMLLPIVGVVITAIFAISGKQDSKGKLAKAMLLFHLWILILCVILAAIVWMAFSSLSEKYPELKNAAFYIKAYAENGFDGVVKAMSENGDLETLTDNIDFEELVEHIDMNKLLEKVDVKVIIDNIDTDKLIKDIDLSDIANSVDTKQLLELIGSDKIAEYIDFEKLIDSIDQNTLEAWRDLLVNQP